MDNNVSKHSKKVTINLSEEDYVRLLELSDEASIASSEIARKLFLDGLDKFVNPAKIALEKMRG